MLAQSCSASATLPAASRRTPVRSRITDSSACRSLGRGYRHQRSGGRRTTLSVGLSIRREACSRERFTRKKVTDFLRSFLAKWEPTNRVPRRLRKSLLWCRVGQLGSRGDISARLAHQLLVRTSPRWTDDRTKTERRKEVCPNRRNQGREWPRAEDGEMVRSRSCASWHGSTGVLTWSRRDHRNSSGSDSVQQKAAHPDQHRVAKGVEA